MAAGDPRLRGQDVSIRILEDARPVTSIDSVASFNDNTKFEIKSDGFLGEVTERKDTILHGYGGDFEFQVHEARWLQFLLDVEAKAARVRLITFNVVRLDSFANGSSAVITYKDVAWGEFGQGIGSRADYLKIKAPFECSARDIKINQI